MESQDLAKRRFYEALSYDDAAELYEHAPCGYLSTAPDGRIIKANQTLLTWTGYTVDELVGRRSFVDLLTGGGRIYHETHYAPMLRLQSMVRELALDLVRADGSRIPVLVNATLHRDADGEPVAIRIALFEAAERREYERQLLAAKRQAEAAEGRARTLVQTLQRTLMPPRLPVVDGLDAAAAYHPGGGDLEVGGDFYDLFEVDESCWVAVLGDVCGKGAEAAIVTALVRFTVRAAAVRQESASAMLHAVNEVMLHDHDVDRHCTLLVVRLRRHGDRWEAEVSSGGHPLPLLLRPDRAPVPVGVPGTIVGVLSEAEFTDSSLLLGPGESLVLTTDGVTEARRGQTMYGEERLAAVVGRCDPEPVEAVVAVVVDDVREFLAGGRHDDIAVLALGVPGSATR